MNGAPTKSPPPIVEAMPSTSKQAPPPPPDEVVPMDVDPPPADVTSPPDENAENNLMSRPLYCLYLDLVLRYLPKRYWRVFRLVCKAWFHNSLSQWRTQMRVKLLYVDPDSPRPRDYIFDALMLNHIHPTDTAPDSPNFLKILESPYSHVTMLHQTGSGLKDTIPPISSPYWNQFGSWLKTCKLQSNTLPVHIFKQFVNLFSPQLEVLEVINCTFEPKEEIESNDVFEYEKPPMIHLQKNLHTLRVHVDREHVFGLSWMHVLSVYPNLRHLIYKGGTDSDVATVLTVIGVIREATRRKTLNLKTFDVAVLKALSILSTEGDNPLPARLEGNTLTQLVDLNLSLSHIAVSLEEVEAPTITSLIQTHKKSLRALELGYIGTTQISIQSAFDFTILPEQLTMIRLAGPIFEGWEMFCYLPNLQKFYMVDTHTTGTIFNIVKPLVLDDLNNLRRRGKVMSKLDTFQYTCNNIVHPCLLTEIIRLAPNVTNTILNVNDQGLAVVCQNWKQLEHVKFYYNISEDVFINNINNLQKLKTFRMIYPIAVSESPFGDRSIFEGFLALPNLHKVEIVYAPNTSQQALFIAKARFGCMASSC